MALNFYNILKNNIIFTNNQLWLLYIIYNTYTSLIIVSYHPYSLSFVYILSILFHLHLFCQCKCNGICNIILRLIVKIYALLSLYITLFFWIIFLWWVVSLPSWDNKAEMILIFFLHIPTYWDINKRLVIIF